MVSQGGTEWPAGTEADVAPAGDGPYAPPATRLVGRDRELAAIARAVSGDGPSGVMFVGPPGVGLTRLVHEAVDAARTLGWTTQFVPATHAPFTAELEDVRLIGIDDAHLLSPGSAVRLHELALARQAVVVLAARTGMPVPPPVVGLWKDGGVERLEVAPLDRREHDALVVSRLGGQVDGSTLAQLWRLTRGNVRYLDEVVGGGLGSRALVRVSGVWTWRGAIELPARLVDLIQLRIGDLDDAQTAALELVSVGEPVGIDVLVKAGAQLSALETLETRGVVGVSRSGRRLVLRCTHPLIAAVVRRRCGHLRTRSLHRRLAAAWVLVAGCRRDDSLRLSSSLVAGGDAVPAELGTAAAARAASLLDFPLSERLARRALDSGAGPTALELLGDALVAQGRSDEAETVLAGLDPGAATEGQLAAVAMTRSANLYWSLNRRDDAHHVLSTAIHAVGHPRVRADLRTLRARMLMSEGEFRVAAEFVDGAHLAAEATRVAQPFLAVTRMALLAAAGRSAEALECGREALGLFEEPAGQAGPMMREELLSQLCDTHLLRGETAQALEVARAGYQRATIDRYTVLAAWWAVQLGKVALAQGRSRTALRYLKDAAARARLPRRSSIYQPLVRRTVLRELVRAHVLAGDPAAAGELAAEIRSPGPFRFVDLWHPDPAIWLAAGQGDHAGALELVLAQAERARAQGAAMLELLALHHAVRLDAAPRVAARMTELGALTDGDLAATLVRHAEALLARDAGALVEVAEAFAAMGSALLAAEAGGQAVRLHEAAGRTAAARRVTTLAHAWTAACEGASTPGLALLHEPPGLTGRQRQIARLAAQGLASRAIADQLVLSVRTVDNSLGQIYRRLGIDNRADLGRLLGAG